MNAKEKTRKRQLSAWVDPEVFGAVKLESAVSGRTIERIVTDAIEACVPRHRVVTEPAPARRAKGGE